MDNTLKKIFILLQIILVGGICVLVVSILLRHAPPVRHEPDTWRSWNGFFVLSYAGVTKGGDSQYIGQKKLEEQLNALKQAGYETVMLDDIGSFLKDSAPLPDKTVLLLFEGGRRDSYLYATPLLQKLGMIGAMCIPTDLMRTYGSFYLSEAALKGLSKQSNWQLCSMGNEAIKNIPTDGSGSKGHFLTHRLWSGGKYEDESSFRKRIEGDYDRAAQILEKAGGKPVVAYLYPYADSGTDGNADPLAADINLRAVSAHHRIAFTSADSPYNGPLNSPYGLNRLRVPANWSGSLLVQELKKYEPLEMPVASIQDDSIWVKKGNVTIKDGKATLSSGSGLWLRGADAWSDLDISLSLHFTGRASGTLFVRYEGKDSHLRLVADSKQLTLSEQARKSNQTLARGPATGTSDNLYRVRLRVKGNRAWVWHNNNLIADRVPLSRTSLKGKIGVNAQNGDIEIIDFKVSQIPNLYVFADSYEKLPPPIREQIKAVLPLWRSDTAAAISDSRRKDLMTAASSGVLTIPILEAPGSMGPDVSNRFADGLEVSLRHDTVRPLLSRFAVRGLDAELSNALQKKGYKIVRILTPSQAMTLAAKDRKSGDELFLIDGPEKEVQEALDRLLHFFPPDRLIVRTDSKGAVPPGVGTAGIASNIGEKAGK